MENPMNQTALDRYLSPLDGWAMGFGCAVGWGAFVMPGTTFLPLAGPAGTAIALLIGAVVMLVIGRCFSYLMNHSTITGGVYSYTKEAFGRDHAFLCSWFLCLSYLTIVFLNGSALFVVIRTLLGVNPRSVLHYTIGGNTVSLLEVTISILAIVLVGVLFLAAKPALQRLHTALSVLLAAGVAIIVVLCLPKLDLQETLHAFGTSGVSPGYAVSSLVILAPWAFVGFEVISFDTAHFRFPIHKTWRIVLTAILTTGFAYGAMALVSVAAVPDSYGSWQAYIQDLANLEGVESIPTFHAASAIMGRAGLAVAGITALAAILTGIIGGYRATVRVLSTMAEDRILSEKFRETAFSILFIMILSVLISLLGRNTLSWFVDLTAFGAIVAYGYTAAAARKIAKAEDNREAVIFGTADPALSEIPIIAMTTNAFREDENAAFEAGMDAHIAKPIDVEKLKNTLTAVLGGQRRSRSSI